MISPYLVDCWRDSGDGCDRFEVLYLEVTDSDAPMEDNDVDVQQPEDKPGSLIRTWPSLPS
jgi:hypothetical protein